MEEGRVYTHGTLSAVRRRSDRAGAALSSERLPSTDHLPSEGSGMLLLEGSGTYSARPRVVTRCGGARPSWGPTLASHGPNVRCKKTYRATQRTNLLASVTL